MRNAFSRRYGALLSAPLSLLIAGCAVHPLPENVAALNTVEIVDHIRCETYEAMRHQIVLIFKLTGTPEALETARQIEEHPERSLQEFKNKTALLRPEYQKRIVAFKSTTIGYGFRFNISEENIISSELNFGLPWNPLSNFTLKAGGSIDKKRTNTRRFFKVDTFEELLLSHDCLKKTLNEANLVYPITGKIGLMNVVDDFFKLTTSGAKTEGSHSSDIKNFSEQLTFTTEITGSISPKVKVAPVTDQFKLADASGTLAASRTDTHELTLTFDVGKGFDPAKIAASAPARRDAVIQELNTLRLLDAAERRGGVVVVP